MIAQDRSTTPTCTTCGYTLTGLERDAARMVVCPECGLRQEPVPAAQLGSLVPSFLWTSVPMTVLMGAGLAARSLGWEDHGRMLTLCGLAAGLIAPSFCGLFAKEGDIRSGRMLICLHGGLLVNLVQFLAFTVAFVLLIGL